MLPTRRILITGAAGNVARSIIPYLEESAFKLRLVDIVPIESSRHETTVADLADFEALHSVITGCDAIVHLGGYPREGAWATIRRANIDGTFNLFEAAKRAGVRRIVLASSTHVIGFESRDGIVPEAPGYRPDSIYGAAKLFGEGLASFYVDRHGFEVMVLRIGLLAPKPRGFRNLSNWIHPEDLAQLCEIGVTSPDLGFSIVYGVSTPAIPLFDNARAVALGYRPRHSSATFAGEMENFREDTDGFVGGPYVRGPDQSSFS